MGTEIRFQLAGVQYRQLDFKQANVMIQDQLRLMPEPNNVYDSNAIAVYKGDIHIGYVPRKDNKGMLASVAAGKATCVVEAAMSTACWVKVEIL